jgi:hypothetical protein
MAYASSVEISPVNVINAGIDISTLPVTPTATHGNKFVNDGKTFMIIKNGSGAPITVTIDTPGSMEGLAIADLAVTIAAGVTKAIGPFSGNFNQADGYVWAVCSAVVTVTMGVYRIY